MKDKEQINFKSDNDRKISIAFKIFSIIFLIITITFYALIIKLDFLPNNYILVLTILEIIFTFFILIGLNKNHKTYKINIICIVIAIIISGAHMYMSNYAYATNKFLETVLQENKETEEYYLIVRKSSSYKKIEDLNKKNIVFFKIEEDIRKKIKDIIDISFEEENNLINLGEKLINQKTDIILVSSSQYNILTEEIKEFKDNTNIIYKSNQEIKNIIEVNIESSKHTIKTGTFNVYISGIDTSGSINNVSRSDANIIATINKKTHTLLLTSIPRDYYITLHNKNAKDKLTHSGLYGINETLTTVEDLLDIDINYYVRVNFTTVIKLVNTLGGINVYSNYDFNTQGYNFNEGYNYLDGERALAFSRERYSFVSGDSQRVKNQQAVIEAIIKKVMNSNTILTEYTDILESLKGSFQTNIEQKDISNLVKYQLNNMSSWKIVNNTLTGTGSYQPTYSMGQLKSYVMLPDETSIVNAKEKIYSVLDE